MVSQNSKNFSGETDFSLVFGGPLYQLYLRTGLALPTLELVPRRVLVFVLICWFPPFALSLFTGRLTGGVSIPFLFDAEVQIRCLIAIPLLVGSELFVHRQMQTIVQEFLERDIIAPEDRPIFADLVASVARLRNSVTAEAVLLLIAATAGAWAWSRYAAPNSSSWYKPGGGADSRMTAAALWYAFVSLSILRFLVLRWYFRVFIWYRFLWRVRLLPLRLNYFHPDRAAGLGFLEQSLFAFAPVLVAQSVIVAATFGNRLWHLGAKLIDFEAEMLGVAFWLVLIVLAPLCFFVKTLNVGRLVARREFGILASRYVNDFRRKWIHNGNDWEEELLGDSDIQSLADLGNSYGVVEEMRIVPFKWTTALRILILMMFPMASLVLTMVPFVRIVNQLLKLAL
jgi:hypothetical protein